MIDIIVKLIIPIICIVLSYYIIPLLKQKKLYDSVCYAVQAAEQIFSEKGMGKEKYEYVSELISEKIKISEQELKNIIESMVYMLNSGK